MDQLSPQRLSIGWLVAAGIALAGLSLILPQSSLSVAWRGLSIGLVGVGFLFGLFSRKVLPIVLGIIIFSSCFEGPLKYLTDESFEVIIAYIGRDLLLYGLVLGVLVYEFLSLRRQRKPYATPPLTFLLLCFLLNLFIQIFNPYSYSPLASFLNSKMFWEMFPLYFLGFYSLRSLKAWQSVFMVFLVMASLNGAVAVYQSSIGPEVISNWGPGYYSQIYGVASRTFRAADGTLAFRPMGLGSDAGFSGALGIITLPMLITLFLKRRQSSFWQDFYLYVLLAGVAIAIYASASRTTLILSLVFGIFSTLFLIRETSQWRLFGTLIAATLLIGVILQQLPTIAPYLGGRYDSIGSLDETVTTFTAEGRDSQISSIPLELSSRFFLGAGLDNLGPGAGAVSRITHTRLRPQLQNSENNINLTILGLGVPGLIVWLLLHLQFIRLSWEASSLVQDRQLQTYLAGAFALMVLFLIFWPFSNLISFPQNLLFWLLPGMAAGTLDEARKTAANAS